MAFFIDEFDHYDSSDYQEVSQRLDDASDWFEEVIDILYGKKHFDENRLECALDEISCYLKVKLPNQDLAITMKPLNEKFQRFHYA
jgi:hypothetical protein